VNKEVFDKLIGEKISVLVDNQAPSGKRETYIGELKESGKDYICLVLVKSIPIKVVYVKHSLILSVWVYS
jgi:hypothetical protein